MSGTAPPFSNEVLVYRQHNTHWC